MKQKIKNFFVFCIKLVLFLGFLSLSCNAAVYVLKNISIELSGIILEYLKVVVWPFIALMGIILFRPHIAGLMGRLIKGKMFGVEVEALPSQPNQKSSDSTEVKDVGEDFKEVLNKKETEISALRNTSEELLGLLTRAQVELDFEKIYNFIFSSQIELLNKISNLEGEVAWPYVVDHFSRLHQTFSVYKENNWDVTKYLQFLIGGQLIEYKNKDNAIFVSITTKGKAFISYLAARNYKKNDFL